MSNQINNLKSDYFNLIPPKPRSENKIMDSWNDSSCNPLVSIVCHTYNHLNYIKYALNSFLMQETGFPFEIIVHDDASTDGTREILKEYAANYPNIIHLICQERNQYKMGRRPISFSWPKAIGKYIAFCEGDDFWTDKNKISIQAQYLDLNPDVVITFHNAYRIRLSEVEGLLLSPKFRKNYSSRELLLSPFIPTLTRMVRKFNYTWISMKDLPIAGDICLSSFAGKYGGAAYLDSISPSVYRVNEGGVWSDKSNAEKVRISVDASLFIAGQHEREGNAILRDAFFYRAVDHIVLCFSCKVSLVLIRKIISMLCRRLFSGLVRYVVNTKKRSLI